MRAFAFAADQMGTISDVIVVVRLVLRSYPGESQRAFEAQTPLDSLLEHFALLVVLGSVGHRFSAVVARSLCF